MKGMVKMTEGRAIALTFVVMLIVFTGVCFLLGAWGAGGTAFGLAMMLIGGAAAHICSLIVMHYSEPSSKDR